MMRGFAGTAGGAQTKEEQTLQHRFLIHRRGDHVGVAVADISAGERVVGIHMDDDTPIEIEAVEAVPLGHKIAISPAADGEEVLEYGVRIGLATGGFQPGSYVHTHNLRSARW
jgi:(2R)-sulfolactate sulfo-lyase subunit alpha